MGLPCAKQNEFLTRVSCFTVPCRDVFLQTGVSVVRTDPPEILDHEKGNLTHNTVCSVCGRCAGGGAVVVRTIVAMESGHRRKTGINLSRGV